MKRFGLLGTLLVVLLTAGRLLAEDSALITYGDVPGLAPSDQYRLRVRLADAPTNSWRPAFAFITTCKSTPKTEDAYFTDLANWSNTYINFEMARAVEVEIARADGRPIRKASAHPAGKVESCVVRDGKAYVRIPQPCLIAVDIDGQMDDQDTGLSKRGRYRGPPIHTVTVFANPLLKDRPRLDAPEVHLVKPGERPPSDGTWRILYFLPGVHDLGPGFPVHANKQYYLPGDALVYGTLNNGGNWKDGHDIRIFGYGTLSGARLKHPKFADPKPADPSSYDPVWICGAQNTTVEGITIADSAHHSLMLLAGNHADGPTDIRWVKIFTWRANGDGINPFSNGLVEDCFLRTQDDATYVNGRGLRRNVYWNDANGSVFVLSALPNRPLVVEDCDVIYARAVWNKWSGGRIFNMRCEGGGPAGNGVVFRNIRVEDSRPTLQTFFLLMQPLPPYTGTRTQTRKPGDLGGIRFESITVAASSVLDEPEILWGMPDGRIRQLSFDGVSIGGKTITNLNQFRHNEWVEELRFR
ncbi:MAG: endo-polygalacturonase [Verrucomicrobiota bacterium]